MAKKIEIVTTTFYTDRASLRFHLASQMIGDAIASGYGVTILDGSPKPEVNLALRNAFPMASIFEQTTKGMGASRRELFGHLLDRKSCPDIVVWTEPEKTDLIRHIDTLTAPIMEGKADLTLPCRTQVSYGSYPEAQAKSEQAANAVFAEVTGKPYDMMVGPVAFAFELLPLFAECNPEAQFGASDTYIQQFGTMLAMAKGRRITSVPIDFFYPAPQKFEEETLLAGAMAEKRQKQLDDLSNGFRLAADALHLMAQAT